MSYLDVTSTLEELKEMSQKYLFNTYGERNVAFIKGQGCYLYDIGGREYLDFISGIAVNNLGHSHPVIVDAIKLQSEEVLHTSNLYLIKPQILLAQKLCDNSFAEKVFFCNSGTEANESAIKLVRKYSKEKYGDNRYKIISMKGSFHGRTMGALSATAQDKVRRGFEPFLEGFEFAEFNDIKSLQRLIDNKTCAVILEPIQGEVGVVPAEKSYLENVREICTKNDLLLIFDEIQCGMGRTSKLFAYQYYGVEPDIMTLAKALANGLPIGAMLAKDEVAEAFKPSNHASTFGGNFLVTRTACAVLDILLNTDLLENVKNSSRYLFHQLEELASEFKIITKIRGIGLMIGIVFNGDAKTIQNKLLENGLLTTFCGENVIRILPPLIVKKEDIDRAINIFRETLSQIENSVKRTF